MATGFINPGDLLTGSGTPDGFTARWGTSISVEENVSAVYGKEIRVAGGNPSLFSIDALDSAADTEVVMLFRIDPDMAKDIRAGVWARVPAATEPASHSGYLGCLFRTAQATPTNRIQIVEYNAGSNAGAVAELQNDWEVSTRYWIRYRVNGTNLQFRMWAEGASEPGTWTIEGTDATFSSGGWCGLGWIGSGTSRHMYVEALGWATGEDEAPTSAAGSPIATPSGWTFTAAAASRQLNGSWTAVAEAGTYQWEVEEEVGFSWEAFQSGSTASTSFQLTDADGVEWARTYRGRVRAVPA